MKEELKWKKIKRRRGRLGRSMVAMGSLLELGSDGLGSVGDRLKRRE